jgi:ribosomal protein S18 acetylase RimI-like enzyme
MSVMTNKKQHELSVERIASLTKGDMLDLCDATVAAIELDGGFGWVEVPERESLQRYWNGVVAVPQRDLFIARMDKAVVGTVQLMRVAPNNQAQSFSAQVTGFFVAPWARGQGLGQALLELVETRAKELGLYALNLDVRETQYGAIKLFKKMGYTQWGLNPLYALVKGRTVPGYFFHKIIQTLPTSEQPIET